ncbi:MAG TPA: PilZ domain-containing protein [Sphingomonadaceae bacterium]|nr:PilZ domain-containing protein [Sphingomonadaceae bacterium]
MLARIDTSAGQPGKLPERRGGKRHSLLMRVAKLRCLSGEYACIVHDVSETGAKLRLFHDHPPEMYMFLELSNGELYAIERRWIDGEFSGFRFSAQVEVEEFTREQSIWGRRPIRLSLQLPVAFMASGEPGQALMLNFSAQGACIEAGRRIPVGQMLKIEIPGVETRYAHICWRREYRHGLAFQEALALTDFARLAHELQPYGENTGIVGELAGKMLEARCG